MTDFFASYTQSDATPTDFNFSLTEPHDGEQPAPTATTHQSKFGATQHVTVRSLLEDVEIDTFVWIGVGVALACGSLLVL